MSGKMDFVHAELLGARLQVMSSPTPQHGGAAFVGGLVPDGTFPDALRQTRDRRAVDAFNTKENYSFRADGTYLYGGLIYGHFGHIMSEMIHRILTTRACFRERTWLFVGLEQSQPLRGFHYLPSSFRSALDFLDVARESVLCVHTDTTVEYLNVAEQGSDFAGGPKPGYLALLRAYSEPRLNHLYPHGSAFRRVYVSRSHFSRKGGFLGERYLERMLESEGFVIFHPEEHPLAWQMEVYRRAETLIFPEGSACHGVELLGNDSLKKCVFLEKRKSHQKVFHNILKPRSETFIGIDGFHEIGSAIMHPKTGKPEQHAGVWMYDPNLLIEQFRKDGIAKLDNFTSAAYHEESLNDLEEYLTGISAHNEKISNDLLSRFNDVVFKCQNS